MSIVLDAAADGVSRTTSPPSPDANYASLFWFYFAARPSAGAYATLFSINNSSNSTLDWIGLIGTSASVTNLLIAAQTNNGDYAELAGSTNLSTGTWYCGALRRSANNSRIGYIGTLTTALAQEVNFTTSYSGRTAASRVEYGASGSGNADPFNGRIAQGIIWTADIPLVDLEVQHYYDTLIIKNSVYSHLRMTVSTDVNDWSGQGRTFTADGTLATEAHPSIFVIGHKRGMVPAAGGTLFTQDVSGSVTPTGALLKQVARALAGSVTPSGVLIKQTSKAFTGSTTASGALAKQTSKAFTGSVTPSGSLTALRTAYATLAGSITATGDLIKQTAKAFTGSVTPSGSLTKQANKDFAGSVTPSGDLSAVRTVLLALTGSITATGALIKQTAKAFVGSITPSGSLTKHTTKTFTGTIEPSGDLNSIKTVLVALAGSITATGTLIKQVGKVLIGSITPSGTLTKHTTKTFDGSITPSGTLDSIRTVLVSLTGSITATGALAKQTLKSFAGSIIASGTITKLTGKSLDGSVTPSGVLSSIKAFFISLSGSITPSGDLTAQGGSPPEPGPEPTPGEGRRFGLRGGSRVGVRGIAARIGGRGRSGSTGPRG